MERPDVTNEELAGQLKTFANLIEIKGENAFRVSAFRRAGDIVEELNHPVSELIEQETLTDIPGIGPAIASALQELLATGRFAAMDEVLDEVPGTLLTMLDIPGVGPKTVARFYHELGITDLVQLESAARRGSIRELRGFGARQEAKILKGIAFLNKRTGRLSIGTALPVAESLVTTLEHALGIRVSIAGSTRRMCETVGNIDLVAASTDEVAIANALSEDLAEVRTREDGVLLGDHACGVQVRVRTCNDRTFGRDLIRWTGGTAFVRALEANAGGELPEGGSEADVFARLDMQEIPPELREHAAIIDEARQHRLPTLLTLRDIRGDLHLHSDWSDGHGTILEMATRARELGYEYLSIADHSGGLGIAHGLDVERLREQRIEIDRVNELVPEIRLLRASEVEVHLDGMLDFPDEVISELDLVVASLHSGLGRSTAELTERIVKVMRNPHVDIVAHPTGRIIERRPGGSYDWETVFRVAVETGTALEINANPSRLDMSDEVAREANLAGVMITVDTDAHDVRSLDLMRYGIGVAQRAGISSNAIINTRPLDQLLGWLSR